MMSRFGKYLRWREILPRVLVDLAIIHLSLLAAFVISADYHGFYLKNPAEPHALLAAFTTCYVKFCWLLAPIFIVTFALSGFYTRSRAYRSNYKAFVILRGVGIGVALFLTADFFLSRGMDGLLGRGVTLLFAVFAALGVSLARVLKNEFDKYFEVVAKAPALAVVSPRDHKVLVVGGAGYIGSVLVRRLLEQGRSVRVLDALLYGAAPVKDLAGHPNFELVEGDSRNISDVVAAMEDVESVIHLAAIVGDPACARQPEHAREVNYAATRMLIEVCKGHRVGRFIFASSCSVYGATNFEVDEQAELFPLSLYARTKVDSEQVLLQESGRGLHSTVVRFATVFGLGYRPRFDLVVNLLCAKAFQEGVITIYNGQQWRPFIHVADAARAIGLLLEAPLERVSGEVFNVGDPRLNHTLADVGRKISQVFPATRVEHIDNADRRNYRVSFAKFFKLAEFRSQYELDDGIMEFKRAFEARRITNYNSSHYHNERLLAECDDSLTYKSDFDEQIMAALAIPRPIRRTPRRRIAAVSSGEALAASSTRANRPLRN